MHLVGKLGELEIPPGLTALIASRLDALGPDERRLVKECSVLGASFPRQAIEAISDTEPGQLDELLSSLVRKEVLTVRADKLSPERGQYAFTQSLIRSVAYDMLTRAERKARHLRTAEHLQAAFPDEGAEVAEVIAAHLYDAYKAAGEDPDAEQLGLRACRAYALAAERAESVGAPEAAESAYLRAAELSSDEREQAGLTEQAGHMAHRAGWYERAAGHFEIGHLYSQCGSRRVVEAARVSASLGYALTALGRAEQAITQIRGRSLTRRHRRPARGSCRSSGETRRCSHLRRPYRRGDRGARGGAYLCPAPRAPRRICPRRSIRRPRSSRGPDVRGRRRDTARCPPTSPGPMASLATS